MSANKAYLYLIRLLSSRDYSEYKLREKLKGRNHPANEIDEAIQKIKDQNYLKEDLYIEARVKAFMNKGCSPYYIKQKLKQEHLEIDSDTINEIFDEHKVSDDDQLQNLIRKKFRASSDPSKDEAKVLRFLISKGHDYSSAKKAFKKFMSAEE
jgi:regulatory protein